MAPQYEELVELLIDGARFNDAEDVQAALDQGADINSQDTQGRTAVHMAAANGHADLIQGLIDRGAAVNLANIEGNTPLHWACVNGRTDVVRVLMGASANPSALNTHDMTPVDEALIREFQEIVDIINEFNTGSKKGVEEEVDDVPDGDDEVEMMPAAETEINDDDDDVDAMEGTEIAEGKNGTGALDK